MAQLPDSSPTAAPVTVGKAKSLPVSSSAASDNLKMPPKKSQSQQGASPSSNQREVDPQSAESEQEHKMQLLIEAASSPMAGGMHGSTASVPSMPDPLATSSSSSSAQLYSASSRPISSLHLRGSVAVAPPSQRSNRGNDDDDDADADEEFIPKKNENGFTRTFPQRLMDVLNRKDAEKAIVWMPEGLSFVIISPRLFVGSILPKYFKQTKFASFTRKLNRWGFKRITKGPNAGAYHHKLFQRDNPGLCVQMFCQKTGEVEDSKHTENALSTLGVMGSPVVMGQSPSPHFQGLVDSTFVQNRPLASTVAASNNIAPVGNLDLISTSVSSLIGHNSRIPRAAFIGSPHAETISQSPVEASRHPLSDQYSAIVGGGLVGPRGVSSQLASSHALSNMPSQEVSSLQQQNLMQSISQLQNSTNHSFFATNRPPSLIEQHQQRLSMPAAHSETTQQAAMRSLFQQQELRLRAMQNEMLMKELLKTSPNLQQANMIGTTHRGVQPGDAHTPPFPAQAGVLRSGTGGWNQPNSKPNQSQEDDTDTESSAGTKLLKKAGT